MSTYWNVMGNRLSVINIVRAIGLVYVIYSLRDEIRSEWVHFTKSKENPQNQISNNKINHDAEKVCRVGPTEVYEQKPPLELDSVSQNEFYAGPKTAKSVGLLPLEFFLWTKESLQFSNQLGH